MAPYRSRAYPRWVRASSCRPNRMYAFARPRCRRACPARSAPRCAAASPIRLRRVWRRFDDVDAGGGEHRVEDGGGLGVAVAESVGLRITRVAAAAQMPNQAALVRVRAAGMVGAVGLRSTACGGAVGAGSGSAFVGVRRVRCRTDMTSLM